MRRGAVASVVTVVVTGAVVLAGCSGGGDKKTADKPPAERLAAARATLEKAPAVSFTLESQGLPSKAIGVSGAKGTGLFTPPSFKGTLNATINGVTGTVEVIAVEQDVYLKFFTPGYNKIDPKTYGAPNPAQLFDTKTGVTSLVGDTTDLKAGGRTRDGAAVLDTFTGKVPGDAVADLFVIGDRSGTFDITYGVTDEGNELRSVVLKGPFYAGSTSTYTVRLSSLPQAVAITRP
ncbi:LppX_LprAFG lipoprotein [Knoellia koreensis]|uniref:LppX_LprAFG lipoprotein n=1 Tax=Knoellia koreensis TaxID=2730921 RepID=A0A849HKV7_9MICO|nr:LppX_LprAFG lipoprotein [Knoellia sp. DB2414S]NNM47932.1 LppX_LprAFG lipoprotein [Knoellia sp. DB2414S]